MKIPRISSRTNARVPILVVGIELLAAISNERVLPSRTQPKLL